MKIQGEIYVIAVNIGDIDERGRRDSLVLLRVDGADVEITNIRILMPENLEILISAGEEGKMLTEIEI